MFSTLQTIISGEIPSSIGNLKQFESLDLSNNSLEFFKCELGFIFGFGSVIGPIMFWKQWRVVYWKLMDKILC